MVDLGPAESMEIFIGVRLSETGVRGLVMLTISPSTLIVSGVGGVMSIEGRRGRKEP